MQLYSTKNPSHKVSFKEAVFKGLPADNGLYMPTSIPKLPDSFFENIEKYSFKEIAVEVCKALIGEDIPAAVLEGIIDDVITFDAPLVEVEENVFVLELFHGPSLAFKDFGARFMARVMSYFLEQEAKEINILVATSGDTGSAVAQGFYKMPGIKVTILYPSSKVSEIQEKQLTTLGHNITALEINGTFDDCQRLVKEAFLDESLNKSMNLSSANSINISRLIPQSFYYFYAWSRLKQYGKPVVFSVPSGNFGNLCGGLIAKQMGLPIHKFIAATNANDIVPEYLASGIFTPRPSVSTVSNAMDVGNPSNFARLLALYGNDLDKMQSEIIGKSYTDEETKYTVNHVFEKTKYVLDPHGAIGYLGLKEYMEEDSDCVGAFLATAHPSKFLEVVQSLVAAPIILPDRLQAIVNKKKSSIEMDKDFDSLKDFLLKTNVKSVK
ncbi:MAG TPA: threonine synthase [Cytophagaceae bacterium]|jgi:threonine synthase